MTKQSHFREQCFFFIVTGVTVVFARGFLETFDLTKAAWTWLGSFLILAMWCFTPTFQNKGKRVLIDTWPLIAVLIFASIATFTSPDIRGSLAGQDHRFTGLTTLVACSLLAFFAVQMSVERFHRGMLHWAVAAALPISIYTILQFTGADPFEWSISSFGNSAFSTLGNPNVLAATVAILMPLLFSGQSLGNSVATRFASATSFILVVAAGSMAESFQVIFGVLATGVFVLLTSRGAYSRMRISLLTASQFLSLGLSGVILLADLRDGRTIFTLFIFILVVLLQVLFGKAWSAVSLFEIRYWFLGVLSIPFLIGVTFALRSQISSAGYERSAFYRAAWSAFLDRPVLGHGLENFGAIFPSYRPEWHALELQTSLTNSAHSVFLGALSSGGILYFISFVGLFAMSLVRTFKRWRIAEVPTSYSALIACLVSAFLIFSISVESVPLFVLAFVFAGAGLGCTEPEKPQQRRRIVGAGRRQFGFIRAASTVVVGLFIFLTARPVVLAEVKYQDGMDLMYLDGRPDLAEPVFTEVVKLRPDESRYRLQLANSLLAQSKFESAAIELFDAVVDSNYNTNLVLDIESILYELGRGDLADQIRREAAARDRYSPSLR